MTFKTGDRVRWIGEDGTVHDATITEFHEDRQEFLVSWDDGYDDDGWEWDLIGDDYRWEKIGG